MYQIIAYDNPTAKIGQVIFDPRIKRTISAGTLTLSETAVDNMELTINPQSSLYNNVRSMQTHIEVKQNGQLLFRGRVLKPTHSMADSGAFTQKLSVESVEAYLMDSVQRWGEYHNISVRDFLAVMIKTHNNQVPTYKQFKLGQVTVKDPNDSLYRFLGYENTWNTINDKLISRLGGYIRVRIEQDGLYLDYLTDLGQKHVNDNLIMLGHNLKSTTLDIDPTKVITRLVPLGATIQDAKDKQPEETTSDVSQPRVTIASVNHSKDYLDIPNLQSEFGIINGTVNWDDVHEPSILLTKAKEWINAQSAATDTWTISAVKLGTENFNGFKLSDSYLFKNPYIAPEQYLRITQKKIDFTKPNSSTLTIGTEKQTLTNYQNELQRTQTQALNKVNQAVFRIDNVNSTAQDAQVTALAAKTMADKLQKDFTAADLIGMQNNLNQISNQLNTLFTNLGTFGQIIKTNQTAINDLNGENKIIKQRLDELEQKFTNSIK